MKKTKLIVCENCAGNGQTVKFKPVTWTFTDGTKKEHFSRVSTLCKSCKGVGYKKRRSNEKNENDLYY